MLPLSAWPVEARRNIIGVFTDIDDTLTTEGAITADALQAPQACMWSPSPAARWAGASRLH
jgi:hypothetical protein